MKKLEIEGDVVGFKAAALKKCEMFRNISENSLNQLAKHATLREYETGETILEQNDPSTFFCLSLECELSVYQIHQASGEPCEIGRIGPYSVFGEMGLLLNRPRSASIRSLNDCRVLIFSESVFKFMFENVADFGLSIAKTLAQRLVNAQVNVPLLPFEENADKPTSDVISKLPVDFILRHRILPLRIDGDEFRIGFVNDPNTKVALALKRFLPGMTIRPVGINYAFFDDVMQSTSCLMEQDPADAKVAAKMEPAGAGSSWSLDSLLRRLVAEGGSDLHLTSGHVPRWRIDGELMPIADIQEVQSEALIKMIEPIWEARNKNEFLETRDTDFSYSLPAVSRFRVNVFTDQNGVGAVFRAIPSTILSLEQLTLPKTIAKLCDQPKGLVLVTGPTGSGKSTTLAAMVDYINKTRPGHIITLEDPIEFLHQSDKSLINQRQVGNHTEGYNRALRAALREDPDVVLVGELWDLETISLAMQTANTGHLVLATMHTSDAVSTINRIIDVFPPDQQNQIRAGICDTLKGIVSQTLCKKIGGGRIAALEILVVTPAVANLIREAKTNQIMSIMQTQKSAGNMLLNEELARLVKEKKVDFKDALKKSNDPEALAKLLNRPLPTDS